MKWRLHLPVTQRRDMARKVSVKVGGGCEKASVARSPPAPSRTAPGGGSQLMMRSASKVHWGHFHWTAAVHCAYYCLSSLSRIVYSIQEILTANLQKGRKVDQSWWKMFTNSSICCSLREKTTFWWTFPSSYAYSGGVPLLSFSDFQRRSDQVIEEAVILEGEKKKN